MPDDKENKKYFAPAMSSELVGAALDARLSLIHIYMMIVATRNNDENAFKAAEAAYLEVDKNFRRLIADIGGFDDPDEGSDD